jgi:hypothetical protein
MRAVFLVALALAASSSFAQKHDRDGEQAKAAHEELLAAQGQGAENAARPGDETLGCEQLQTEFLAITRNPETLAFLQEGAADAQAQLDQLNQAQQQAQGEARRGIGRAFVQGAVTTAVPILGRGAARAQQAAQAAQNAQLQAQAEKNVQSVLGKTDQLAGMVGPMMRGQHIMELAQARNCAWLQEAAEPPPGAPSPLPDIPIPRPTPPAPQ